MMLSANSRLTVESKIETLKLLDGGSSERDVSNRFSTGKRLLIVSSDPEATLRICRMLK